MFNLSDFNKVQTLKDWPIAVNALALVVEIIQTMSRLETSQHFKKEKLGEGEEQNISKTKAGSKK